MRQAKKRGAAKRIAAAVIGILVIAAVILVSGLGFSSGITFSIGEAHVTLTNLAIAAIAGIALNAILPGKDYEFGADVTEGRSGDFGRY